MTTMVRSLTMLTPKAVLGAALFFVAACNPATPVLMALGGGACIAACDAIIASIDRAYANGPEHSLPSQKAYPLYVSSSVQSLSIRADGNPGDAFTREEVKALDAFVDDFLGTRYGTLDVAVMLDEEGRSSLVGHAEAVAQYVRDRGVPSYALNVRSARNEDGDEGIELSYERFSVRLPSCGDYSKHSNYNPRNTPHSNWACATMRNLGMMAANPADLAGAPKLGARDAARASAVVRAYRAGTATQSSTSLTVTQTD